MAFTGVTQQCDNKISITIFSKPETSENNTAAVQITEQAEPAEPTTIDGESTEQSQPVQDMAGAKVDEQPEPAEATADVEMPEPPKPKKKKNRGKKSKAPKVKKAAVNKTNNTQQAAGNTAVPAGPPLSKTAKNKLKAQEKAAKTARAAQIAAAAKAKKMGVDALAGETASASGDTTPVVEGSEEFLAADDASGSGDANVSSSIEAVEEISTVDAPQDSEDDSPTDTASSSHSDAGDAVETPESSDVEDVASTSDDVSSPFGAYKGIAYGFGGNKAFEFGVQTSKAALSGTIVVPVNITDVLAGFGRAFSPVSPEPATIAAPLAPKVRKATSFAKAIRKHQSKPQFDSSKTPRDAVTVKLNRKPLPESAKKDHQESNPLFQTLVKKASTSLICAKAVLNLNNKFDVTLPRKPVRKTSKPVKIEYYPPVKDTSVGKVLELDDGDDEEMPDAPSVADAEPMAHEADAPRITEIDDDDLEDAEVVEPIVDTEQIDEVLSEDTESAQSEVEQQDEAATQGTTEVPEQTIDDDITGDTIDEQVSSTSSPVVSEAPQLLEEIIVETTQVDDTPPAAVFKSDLSFLSSPNSAEYPPALSREAEQALIDAHVTPLHQQQVPGTVMKPAASGTKASKKAAAAMQAAMSTINVSEDLAFDIPSSAIVSDMPQLAGEAIFDTPEVDNASPTPIEQSELDFLSFPEAAEFLPDLSPDAEQAVINLHVTPLHLQQVHGAVAKPTACEKKSSKKAAKAAKKDAAKQAAMAPSDVPEESSHELTDAPEEFSAEFMHAAQELAELPSVEQEISDVAREDESTPEVHDDTCAPILPVEQETAGANQTPQSGETAPSAKSPSSASTQERIAIEMNHTLLGITSLGKFLIAVPKSPEFTVTKEALCSTFGAFAATECRILLDRVPPYMDGNFDNRVVQCKTMLGNTSLYEFLQAVQWTGDVASLKEITRVFKEKAAEADAYDTQMQAIADSMAMG